MTEDKPPSPARLEELYVIAEPAFDSLEDALRELEALLIAGRSKERPVPATGGGDEPRDVL